MEHEEHRMKLERELGGINEKLNGIIEKLDERSEDQKKLDNRVSVLESHIDKGVAIVSLISISSVLAGWLISNWNKVGRFF